jgi:transposase
MRKPRNSIPSEAAAAVIAAYQSGTPATAIAPLYNVSAVTVIAFLRKHGQPIRTRTENNHLRAPLNERELRRLSNLGTLSQREIADKLGVSLPTVERALRRLGLRSKRGRGSPNEKNHFWRGGVTCDACGYVLRKAHDHPFCDNRGYVREHRLVMESVLGRYLMPTEVVHHKDGDKANNAPKNLRVFQSNAEHLRDELTGKRPNYTPEGLRRMRENALRLNRRKYGATPKK